MTDDRFERQVPFLTPDGQASLGRARVAVIGVGGLGSHVVQQLAYAGVVHLTLVDADRVSQSNLNRLVTATPADIGMFKVDVLHRFVLGLHSGADTRVVPEELRSHAAYSAVKGADWVIGCLDDDGPRHLLTLLAAAYEKPYLDLASEIGEDRTSYGGRLVFSRPGQGCLRCRGLLDDHEIRAWLETSEERRTHDRIYGQRVATNGSGPSVVALNGVVASLGVMELMLDIAGVRPAHDYRKYAGVHGMIVKPGDDDPDPQACRICTEVRGERDAADLERYIRERP